MPIYHFNETHEISVHAGARQTILAVEEVTPEVIPLFRVLFGIRSLPARLAGKHGAIFSDSRPLLGQMLNVGFLILAKKEEKELVVGTIGQFWRLWRKPYVEITEPNGFIKFDKPDFVKVAMNFYVEERNGVAKLTTETRIYATDPIARKKFAVYWSLIRVGSGLLRRMMLKAIKRRAEELTLVNDIISAGHRR